MNSGINLACVLKTDDDANEEKSKEKCEIRKLSLKTTEINIDKSKIISSISNANGLLRQNKEVEEETELLDKLEASSKGKIKGPFLHYFNASKRPFCLVFIVLAFVLAQILAGSADVFVSRW